MKIIFHFSDSKCKLNFSWLQILIQQKLLSYQEMSYLFNAQKTLQLTVPVSSTEPILQKI